MNTKKALIIGGSVVAGSLLLYLLLRKKPSTQEDTNPLPTTPTGGNGENPLAVLLKEGRKWWLSRDKKDDGNGEDSVVQPTYLKLGDSGNRVSALQRFLNQSSGGTLPVNGVFDAATQAAVKSEQEPFDNFELMFPNSVYGAVSKTYYDSFVKSYE